MIKIKGARSREDNKIEYKGMTPYSQRNNINYVFLTNK